LALTLKHVSARVLAATAARVRVIAVIVVLLVKK